MRGRRGRPSLLTSSSVRMSLPSGLMIRLGPPLAMCTLGVEDITMRGDLGRRVMMPPWRTSLSHQRAVAAARTDV